MKQVSSDKIKAVGMMSGTSLDGMDLVAAEFWQNDKKWEFKILAAKTVSYTSRWLQKLKHSPILNGKDLIQVHREYGDLIGREINSFTRTEKISPDLVCSHGHTVFHQPENGFTFQLGNGANIAATTGIKTVSDFRTQDIALGGQGAPLVPIGDQLLFDKYDCCLNLGGFSNISFEREIKRIAFDICPVNIILNSFAQKQGLLFDNNGELGRKGNVNTTLLNQLNRIDFYFREAPKSLGREWLENTFLPVINRFNIDENDKLRTIYEHIALQIAKVVSANSTILVTGGGAYNQFLIELLSKYSNAEIVLPSNEIIDFKEALIFAFLGVLKIKGQINCLSSVTGAKKDHISGILFDS